MNKETLAQAKELEKDIQQMEFALSYYKRGRWSHWDVNDLASSFHFEFCKNWSHKSADMQDLPTWLNKPLMEVVERELERCKHELETLTDDSAEIITDVSEAGQDTPDPSDDTLTEDEVYDYYQERSVKAGERADQLAWMFIVMMTGGLISGHAFQAFSVCASLAAVYMLLSVVQAVWQTFTSWLFKQQIKKMDVAPHDYPEWVGGGAWLFFWAKMITIASAVIYFVKAIFF